MCGQWHVLVFSLYRLWVPGSPEDERNSGGRDQNVTTTDQRGRGREHAGHHETVSQQSVYFLYIVYIYVADSSNIKLLVVRIKIS